jgi:hypothetical protein
VVLYLYCPIDAVGLCAVVPEGKISAPVALVPTFPLAVIVVADTVVATIGLGVVKPKVPFNGPVTAPAKPVSPEISNGIVYLLNY